MRSILSVLLVSVVFSSIVFAYDIHKPIFIEDMHATADNPYIIEGYEISSESANCIEVINSEHVIIRENYLHDCIWSKEPEEKLSWTEGRAIVVKGSKNIRIENNRLEKNKIGIFAYQTKNVKILSNNIMETQVVGSLKCEYCTDSEIAHNYLIDNGRPDWFWVPGNRVIGIWVAASNNLEIHDNTVIRSSSDGIGISGTIDSSLEEPGARDWTKTAENIRVYNNVLLDNLELGIWLARIDDMECFNNTIRDHFGPIVLDFDIKNSEFYNNKLISWVGSPIGIGIAKDNYIHDNIAYCIEENDFEAQKGDEPGMNDIKFGWSGIEPYISSGNVFENNVVKLLDGELKDALESKINRAEIEKTFEEKGWFACEIEEGVFDEDCMEQEEAKGNQGMPRELFVFEPLMSDFDEYAAEKPIIEGNHYSLNKESNYNNGKVFAILFFITLVLLMIVIVLYLRKN